MNDIFILLSPVVVAALAWLYVAYRQRERARHPLPRRRIVTAPKALSASFSKITAINLTAEMGAVKVRRFDLPADQLDEQMTLRFPGVLRPADDGQVSLH